MKTASLKIMTALLLLDGLPASDALAAAGSTSPYAPFDFVLAHWLLSVGFTLVVIFIILNFGIERIFFPPPHRMTPSDSRPIPPLVGRNRRAHIIMGTIEGALFVAGWAMVVAGFAVLGTRGYGAF